MTRSHLICAVLCMSADRATQTIHEVTNRIAIAPDRLPTRASIVMFVGIAAEQHGPFPLQIAIRYPGREKSEQLATVTLRVPKGPLLTGYRPQRIDFSVPAWGIYWFDVSVEGELRTSVPLTVEPVS